MLEVIICDVRVCRILFVSRTSDIVFNRSAGEITDQSQSSKNIDLYIKSQLYLKDPALCEGPGHEKLVLILQNGLSKPKASTQLK